jgi:hypothetical protein
MNPVAHGTAKTEPSSPSLSAASGICHHEAAPPVPVPPAYVGPVVLPGTHRQIWWTGRVAIGLRYERRDAQGPLTESALWVQELMLDRRGANRPRRAPRPVSTPTQG